MAIPLGFRKCLGDCHDQFANWSRNDMLLGDCSTNGNFQILLTVKLSYGILIGNNKHYDSILQEVDSHGLLLSRTQPHL